MSAQQRIVFHIGGPAFHPVDEQAQRIITWLDGSYHTTVLEGRTAFESLDRCDLLVLMGLHWTGMGEAWADGLTYYPLLPAHQEAFEEYIASGRPVLAHHGAIASYDDWPRFGELVGFTWQWGVTSHSPFGTYSVQPLPTGHTVIDGIGDFTLDDELYYDIQITPGLEASVHAVATWQERSLPMVMTASGGRVPGAGRTAYLANGHDLRAFECPALAHLWRNAIRWLLDSE